MNQFKFKIGDKVRINNKAPSYCRNITGVITKNFNTNWRGNYEAWYVKTNDCSIGIYARFFELIPEKIDNWRKRLTK